jgi:hypothetical protein
MSSWERPSKISEGLRTVVGLEPPLYGPRPDRSHGSSALPNPNTSAAPDAENEPGAPAMMIEPARATDVPRASPDTPAGLTSSARWVQVDRERTNRSAAPVDACFPEAPTTTRDFDNRFEVDTSPASARQ